MAQRFGDVALLGLGASTRAVGEYLAGLPEGSVRSVTAFAGRCGEAARACGGALEACGVRVVYGTEELEGFFDLGVASPGIPCTGSFYASAAAHCRELVSEPELAWRESTADWLAVTGTNGKTTTTALACELLRAAGRAARPVGNIGLPPVACLADRAPGEVFVAEMSSFQLHGTSRFAPMAAAVLNVTPDHLEWHGSFEAYRADKERVFSAMAPDALCLVGAGEECRGMAARLRAAGRRVAVVGDEPGAGGDGAWVDARGRLAVRLHGDDHVLCSFSDMRLKGPHNAQNALVAAALALEAGADDRSVARGLLEFAPLGHRIEPCGEVGGVAFFDDSKGTNVDATLQALGAFEAGRAVVMLGGRDKGTDLAPLAAAVAGRCRGAVAYGAAGPRLYEALEAACARVPGCSCTLARAPHMREAFDTARALARPGDVVLLSPACSSFDEFDGYAERGRTFKAWVAELARAAGDAEAAR